MIRASSQVFPLASGRAAIAGSKMGLSWLGESAATYLLESEAAIWAGAVQTFLGVSKEFDSSVGASGSPCAALFAFANNTGSAGDVCAFIGDSVARNNNGSVFAANLIARNASGTTSTKLVGLEIDVEPATGTTVTSNTAGLYINVFNLAISGAAIQIGGASSGTWGNGIVIDKVTGAGVAPNSGASMTSFINTSPGSFSGAAIILGATHTVKVGSNQVLAARDTGWAAMTGTPDKSTAFATGSVTLAQLAGRVMALQTALTTHGLIGA